MVPRDVDAEQETRQGSTQASLPSGKPTNKTEEEKNASLKI